MSDLPTVTIVVDWEEADIIAALLDHDGEDNLMQHVRYCQQQALKEQADRDKRNQ